MPGWFPHPVAWQGAGKVTFFCKGKNNFVFVLCSFKLSSLTTSFFFLKKAEGIL